ncbi:hypothetical protein [Sporosarcina sp. Te-1]|uniref:hypothetical protein n=1 Tax=Sporosarcina sp. Te-1 TaxID=2818390 RepID=UPI001A9D2864|nr:hypothetical protein [Sporosarcina sp. Te-1]QTD40335.1 hypothetical protein J3U78_16315 [Sporosarcina sp. Te-1]
MMFLGSILSLIMLLLPILVIVVVAYFIVKTVKGFERRADEKLALEREHNEIMRKRIDELNDRVVVIEKLLKDVE